MSANVFIAISMILGHAIQAFGYPLCSTLNAVVWVLGLRAVWMAFIYPKFPTYSCLIQCFVVSWFLTLLCNVVIFAVLYSRYKKGTYKRI